MLCARRGLSWKQKHFTLYPSSPRLAAVDAPASPLPTTITSNLRLFAGFTSFRLKRCLSHFCASGPGGIFASSCILHPSSVTEQNCHRDGTVSEEDGHGRDARELIQE